MTFCKKNYRKIEDKTPVVTTLVAVAAIFSAWTFSCGLENYLGMPEAIDRLSGRG